VERQAVPLARLLRPRSVAIVGVSPEPGSIGANVLGNLTRFGFGGDIHLVSRSSREIDGRRCVSSIDELPDGVDAAVLAVPRQATVEAVTACVRRKVGGALVFASGFAEMDETGRADQEAMARVARDGGLALCGPNCIGFVNVAGNVALTFEPLERLVANPRGGIGVVTQSGAMASTLRLGLLAKDVGISCVVSTGNEAGLITEDFLGYLIDDEATRVIVLFMEQVRDPRLFLALAAKARAQKKPIVLMHPGRSVRARASARTHTGSMTGDHAVMAALVAREAVIRVETLEELIDTAELLLRFPIPPAHGAAIMTNSGAFKGYALDFAETIGLDLPALSGNTAEAIKQILPAFAAIENPIDVTAQSIRDATILGRTAAQLLVDPAMGSLVVSIVSGAPRFAMDKARAILSGVSDLKKPVAVATMGDDTPLPAEFSAAFRERGLPIYRSPDRALRAMARATWYGRAVTAAERRASPIALPNYKLPEVGAPAEYVGKELLKSLGIPVPAGALARDVDEAHKIAQKIGYPVALKAQAATLAHKSDAGGVILNIADDLMLPQAWDRLHANIRKSRPDLALDGVLVETMGQPGLEMVVAARREPKWGPIVTVGLGGVWIEALHDVRLLPADLDNDAIMEEMLKLKGAALLRGLRGAAPADLAALADIVARLGALVRADAQIDEIEINPLVVYPKGVLALDVLLHVASLP
jgi:acyl-CoA synthetase (NDP forming)